MGKIWQGRLWGVCKRYPMAVLIGLVLLGYGLHLVGGWSGARAQTLAERQVRPAQVESPIDRARQEKERLKEQKEESNALKVLATANETQKKQFAALEQRLEKSEATHARERAEMTETVKRLQAEKAQERKKEVTPAPRPAPQPKPVVVTPREHTPPALSPTPTLSTRYSDGKDTFSGQPQTPFRQDTAYLPAWSFAPGVIITGIIGSTRAGGALDMLFGVQAPFVPAHRLMGPERNPLSTSVPLQGCVVGGRGAGDVASSRVYAQLEALICVMPDKKTAEYPIKGYITDLDGNNGVVGEYYRNNQAQEAKAMLTALLSEFSAALGLARSKFIITNGWNTSGPMPGQGIQTGLQKMTDLYIQQMELLMPTVWARSGLPVNLVITQGVVLEGLPTQVILARGK
jgi:hypothetical protein